MTPEALEFLRKRAEAFAAEGDALDRDPLIQARFHKPKALKPIETPTRAGALLRRQAD